MPAEKKTPAVEDAAPEADAAAVSQQAFTDAVAAAEKTLTEAAKRAEKVLKEGVDALRVQAKAYTENAGQHVDVAQRYVVERVKERPVTATLTGFGVGLLLGMLLSSRDR
jgi:ElaB/YqjD/DUF883 family membrane-anchored ribosome-binding protein